MSAIPKSYRSQRCEVRRSPIHGLGLFAAESIASGEVIAIRGGHIVSKERALSLDARLGGYSHPITDDFFLAPLDASEVDDIVIMFNHGCAPNIGPHGQIAFVAMRGIDPGEEILCDYATIVCYPEYQLECACGSRECRGIVAGDDWLDPGLRERYQGWFSTQIEHKIRAHRGGLG
jgi:SET domain-containing protein